MAGAILLVDAGDNVGQLRLLHVEPWARGLGIGSALVAECVAFAREAGYDHPPVDAHGARPGRRIYEAAGFRIVSTEVHHGFGKAEQGETWELALGE
jgi:GNAT superfamily N-acetyltransferase